MEMPNADAERPDDEVIASFREFREYSRGKLDVEHHHVYEWTALVDDPVVREVLAFMKEHYDPREFADAMDLDLEEMPKHFEETRFFQAAVKKFGTETATRAIDEGNVSQTTYITGLPSYRSDISGLHAINELADWLEHSEQCKLIYMAALMGRGKTDLSVTFFEVIWDNYQRVQRILKQQELYDEAAAIPQPEFAANFDVETPDDCETTVEEINGERELYEWADGGSSDDNRWFIFDEASTELTAQSGKNAQKVAETFAPFVKKMRKLGINMIVIGHDKRDVHVAIRSLADFVDKTGTKTASFYAGIKRREPAGHLFDVEGIPPTSWGYDTDDTADWTWIAEEDDAEDDVDGMTLEEFREERDLRIARLYEQTEITQPKIATAFGVSQSTVSTAVSKHDAGKDTGEVGASA